MAETEMKKKKARNPSDEIDPETGLPYEDIPGLEYPEEVNFLESLIAGPAAGPSILRAGEKVGKAAARELTKKAIENMKPNMPTPSQVQQHKIRDPQLAAMKPQEAIQKVAEKELAAKKAYEKSKAVDTYGSSPKPAPEGAGDYWKYQASSKIEGPDVGKYWEQPKRKGMHESDTTSPGYNYSQVKKNIITKIKKPE